MGLETAQIHPLKAEDGVQESYQGIVDETHAVENFSCVSCWEPQELDLPASELVLEQFSLLAVTPEMQCHNPAPEKIPLFSYRAQTVVSARR